MNGMRFDASDVLRALSNGVLDANDLLDIEKPGALEIVNVQRRLVPVDTSETKNSIQQHIQEASGERVVDDIGPETIYAPAIEFGVTSKPNYPIQPFVRPSAFGNEGNVERSISMAFVAKIKAKFRG